MRDAVKAKITIDEAKLAMLLEDAVTRSMCIGGKIAEKVPSLHGEWHTVGEAMCWKCGHRWGAVIPRGKLLKYVVCPECHQEGYAILTGQDVDDLLAAQPRCNREEGNSWEDAEPKQQMHD